MHLLRLRALSLPVSTKAGALGGRRTLKYLVQQSQVHESSRFPANNDPTTSHRQLFEKTWTLSGSKPLEKLKLHLPGVTFISSGDFEEDDDHVAKIRVTSDSADTLEGLNVASKFPYRTILDYHPSPLNHKSVSDGNLLTEILLPRGYSGGGLLRNLTVKGGGLVIVEGGVLATLDRSDETIRLAATQGGRLAIKSTKDVDVGKLQIAVAKRSKVYLQAPNVSARDRIEIAGAGGSEVHLQSHSGFITPLLKVAIAGSGTSRIQAQRFAVDEVKSAIAGSGRIVIAGGGSGVSSTTTGGCNSHGIAIFGAGDVDCADLATKHASVAVAGQGTVALEATDALKLTAFGEAKLAYLNGPPRMVTLKCYHASSPLAPTSDEDRRVRKQQHEAETQEVQDFWSALPSRETALGIAN